MLKAYKYRLFPTQKQSDLLAKHFGHCRFIYNHFLGKSITEFKENNRPWNRFEYQSEIPKMKKTDQPWLKEVNSLSLQASLKNLDTSFKNFFNQKLKAKFPSFKSRRSKQSFSVPQNVRIEKGKLIIPKFLEGISTCFHRRTSGKIRSATLSRTADGIHYVSILCETKIEKLPKAGKTVGIDLGLTTLATLSDGFTIENHRTINKFEKKLAQAQRHLSRKTKGSNRREKQRLKVARLYRKISNIRNDYTHKMTRYLVENYDVICLEDLNTQGLLRNRKLAKHISNVAWGRIKEQLKYKSEWYGKTTILIGRYFASSKLDYECGHKNEISLSDRRFMCQGCGRIIDRDLNAAKNIHREGLKQYSTGTVENKRGAIVSHSL